MSRLIIVILALLIPVDNLAEVILDGTLGPARELTGPEFHISPDLGQQRGQQLFHSFNIFTLKEGEQAIFLGDESLTHIISRVTGGQPSLIDGKLYSNVPHANLYFLNPAGVVFGPHAQLDLPGSFYVSTADVLYLGDTGQFHARFPERSTLSVAPPTAFGFLTHTPAPIEIHDSRLSVSTGQTLSLIGGELSLRGMVSSVFGSMKLVAESGRIDLVSIASEGQVTPTEKGLEYSSGIQGGEIILHGAVIGIPFMTLSKTKSGNLFLYSKVLDMDNSYIWGTTYQENEGGIVEIDANEIVLRQSAITHYAMLGTLHKGTILFKTDRLLLDHSGIRSNAYSWAGPPGHLIFEIGDMLTVAEGSTISTGSLGKNDTGNIYISAKHLLLDGGTIENSAMGTGLGGQIVIRIGENLVIQKDGWIMGASFSPLTMEKQITNIDIESPQVLLNKGSIFNGTLGGRQGGNISIKNVDTFSMIGGIISAGGINLLEKLNTGNSGNIEIIARQINLTEGTLIGTTNSHGGKAGNIDITAQQINLSGNSIIDTKNSDQGKAGNIDITAQQITLEQESKIQSATMGSGAGGMITLHTENFNIIGQKGMWTGLSARSLSEESDAGQAGDIRLYTNHLWIDRGAIATSTLNATGGNITLQPKNWMYLREGQIETNIVGGESNGGNVVVQNSLFSILQGAKIFSSANQGFGGDIMIDSQYFLSAADTFNTLDASSERVERSGKIIITAPSEEVNFETDGLVGEFMTHTPFSPCAERKKEEINYFNINLQRFFPPPENLKATLELPQCKSFLSPLTHIP